MKAPATRRAIVLALLAVSPAAAEGIAFAPAVRQTIETVIVPRYAALTAAAEAEAASVAALCDAPAEPALAAAREGFTELVGAFSAVELFRYGPAREDNRIERLFFWPDPRGRGLAQVQAVIAAEEASAAETGTLRGKSVAVQGLPALEFALFGTGSDALAGEAGFRCRYALAVSGAIAETAHALEAAWRGPFAALVDDAGAANPVYRTHGEAMQDILQAAADQLALVAQMKLDAVIGADPAAAKPPLAPFWRSGNAVTAMMSNLDGIETVLGEPLKAILGDDAVLVDSALFQIDAAREALAAIEGPWETAARHPEAHRRLRFAAITLAGAQSVVALQIQTALGLAQGFNASDGD